MKHYLIKVCVGVCALWGSLLATEGRAQFVSVTDTRVNVRHSRIDPSRPVEISDSTIPQKKSAKFQKTAASQPHPATDNKTDSKAVEAKTANAFIEMAAVDDSEEIWTEDDPDGWGAVQLPALLNRPRRGSWVVGAEYLLVRPHFSEAEAFTVVTNGVANPGQHDTQEKVYYKYPYESSVRGYVAYRLDECCSELRFTYTRLRGSASDSSQLVNLGGGATRAGAKFEITGDIDVANSVYGDLYDLQYSRSLCFSDDCNSCNPCPPWQLTWSAGVRLARMGYRTGVRHRTNGSFAEEFMDFRGAGPIISLQGDHYFGNRRQFSWYGLLEVATLLGQYDHWVERQTGVAPATNTETFIASTTRLIPVAGIELGTRWQPTDRLTFSAGWFFQAWWDLGMTAEASTNGANFNFVRDDANIMSWDGFIARAEFTF